VTAEVERAALRARYGLLLTALAPMVPQILGSAFNIWYNATVIEPMFTPALRQRFFATVVVYNAVVYPIGVYLWLKRIFSFRICFIGFRRKPAISDRRFTNSHRRVGA
jgi:adenylate cyclase